MTKPFPKEMRRAMLATGIAILWLPAALFADPVALSDRHYVLRNRQKYIDLRGFHEDANGALDPDSLILTIDTCPASGTLRRLDGSIITCPDELDGTTCVYVPANGFTGPDSFTFHATAGAANSIVATITLSVEPTYTAPFGLIAPPFGVHEEAGDVTHHVDLTNGLDSTLEAPGANPDWPTGSVAHPRKTLPSSTPFQDPPLAPGNVVNVQGSQSAGSTASIVITGMGTLTQPVFIRGTNAAQKPVFRRGLRVHGQYVILENIDFDGGQSPRPGRWFEVAEKYDSPLQMWLGHRRLCMRHCSFRNHPGGDSGGVAAMMFGATHCEVCNSPPSPADDSTLIEDCVVYDTLVTGFGDWSDIHTSQDYGGCIFLGNARTMWCLDSIFHHIQGSGAVMSRNNALINQTCARQCYVGRNTIHHMKEYPIQNKMTQDSIISQNVLFRARKSDSSLGGAITFDNDDQCNRFGCAPPAYAYSDNVWIIFNEIYDMQRGVFAGPQVHCTNCVQCCPPWGYSGCAGSTAVYGPSRLYVVGNVFHHILPYGATPNHNFGAAFLCGPQVQARFVNNTAYKCQSVVEIACMHNSGNQYECPPFGDSGNLTRNASVAVKNNLVLDTIEPAAFTNDDAHVRACTGPSPWPPVPPSTPLTLTEFDFNLHYEPSPGIPAFALPNGQTYSSVPGLRNYPYTDYADGSRACDPLLCNTTNLDFHPRTCSPHAAAGTADSVYGDFVSAFPGFPSIEHDHDGAAYLGNYPMGAFKSPGSGCIPCPDPVPACPP